MSSEDLELMEIEHQRRLKQQQLLKNQTYFEKVQNKLTQEKIDQAQKEYQRLLEQAAQEIRAQKNKLGFIDRKSSGKKREEKAK